MHLGCVREGGRKEEEERATFRDRRGGKREIERGYIAPPVRDGLPNCTDLGQHDGVLLSKEKPKGTRVQ